MGPASRISIQVVSPSMARSTSKPRNRSQSSVAGSGSSRETKGNPSTLRASRVRQETTPSESGPGLLSQPLTRSANLWGSIGGEATVWIHEP